MKEWFYIKECSGNDVGHPFVCCGIGGLQGH